MLVHSSTATHSEALYDLPSLELKQTEQNGRKNKAEMSSRKQAGGPTILDQVQEESTVNQNKNPEDGGLELGNWDLNKKDVGHSLEDKGDLWWCK